MLKSWSLAMSKSEYSGQEYKPESRLPYGSELVANHLNLFSVSTPSVVIGSLDS